MAMSYRERQVLERRTCILAVSTALGPSAECEAKGGGQASNNMEV
jgi:hypothetical protein